MIAHARRRDIQGLRAIAVLFVIVYHAGLALPGGFTGVDIFFAISGFVITGTLCRELEATDRLNIPGFYVRRIKRLLPALAVMLVVVAAAGVLASPISAVAAGAKTGVAATLFAANGYLYHLGGGGYFDADSALNPLLHTWTLGVEEQFYVGFPLLLLLSWVIARRWPRARRAIVVGAVAVGAVASLLLGYQTSHTFAFYGSPARAWEFAAGALVALCAPSIAQVPRPVAYGLGALGALTLGATGALVEASQWPATAALLPVAGACALLAAGTAAMAGASRLLALAPLVWLGDLSYSWYLWHWPLIVFATALWPLSDLAPPMAAALSLLPAWLSFRYVENPARSNVRIRGRRVVALAAVCVAVPLVACVAWKAAVAQIAKHSSAAAAVITSQQPSVGEMRGCFGAFQPDSPSTRACTWRVRSSLGSVVLLGDSIATALTGVVVAAANGAHFDASAATHPGCPFADLVVGGGFDTTGACRDYYVRSMDALTKTRPSLVVVVNTSGAGLGHAGITLGLPGETPRATGASEQAALWAQGRRSAIRQLNEAGVPVLVLLAPPVSTVTPSDCAVIRAVTLSCPGARSRATVEGERRLMVDADMRVVRAAAAASTLDFIDVLCGPDSCPTIRDGVVLYRDTVHPSVAATGLLTGSVARSIRQTARTSADSCRGAHAPIASSRREPCGDRDGRTLDQPPRQRRG